MSGGYIYLADKSLQELLCLYKCNIKNDDDFYFVIASYIAKSDQDYLLNNLNKFKGIRLRAALFGLAEKKKSKEKTDKVESFLSHSNEFFIAESIDTLRKLQSKQSWAKIKVLLNHKSPYVKGACLRFATFKLGKKAIPLLLSYINDKHHIVRANVADELGKLDDPSVISSLKPLLRDSSKDVRSAAKSTLNYLKSIV